MNNLKIRRQYDAEFKRNTAELYLSGKQTLTKLSEDLGVAESTLYNWVAEYRKRGDESFKPRELTAHEREMIALKKELADIRMERDILKKAIAIFSKRK